MKTTDGHHEQGRTETTTGRLAAKAHETVDTLTERAQRVEGNLRDAAERTAGQARELQQQYAETAERGLKRAASAIEHNPLAFVGLAFVAGVLISAMFRR